MDHGQGAVTAAQEGRTRRYEAVRRFMDVYDFLIVPSAQVFPLDKALR
jgi:amidase